MGWRERATPVSSGGGWRSRATPVPSADNAVPQGGPGFLSQAGSAARRLMDSPAYSTSPSSMLQRVPELASQAFGKAGEFAAEQMGREGANPRLAAGVGTAISMAPDVAMMANPSVTAKAPRPILRSMSRPLAQRHLGFTKRFLSTPFSRGRAAEAADVALEKRLIPYFGNPQKTMNKAIELQEKSGQDLGRLRESAGTAPLDQVFDSLEASRFRATNGLKGGVWDSINRKFDEAQETLLALSQKGPESAMAEIEKAKKMLGKTVNWMADNVSQETAKQITSAIEAGVESIMRSKGIDMAAYGAQKRLYGASKLMQKGLANEISSQAGNNAFSLPTMVAGAGQLATGNVPAAATTLGVVEAFRRRGAGMGAALLDATDRQLSVRPIAGINAFGRRIFRDIGTPEPILQSSNGVRKSKRQTEDVPNQRQDHMAQPDDNGDEQQNQNNQNGNFKGLNDHIAPEKVLTEPKAREYLKKADGDKAKARQLALADGWMIP